MASHIVNWFALIGGLLVCVAATGQTGFPLVSETPAGTRVTIEPAVGTPVVGESADWLVTLAVPGSSQVVSLRFEAGMPEHGHGLPQPAKVVATGRAQVYRAEGVLFNMAGRWRVDVLVGFPDGIESATFDLVLGQRADGEKEPALLGFSRGEVVLLKSLALPDRERPHDPTNRFSGNPEAVRLGGRLFFDKAMSATGQVTCASCHEPALAFTDGHVVSIGSSPLTRNAPSLLGVAGARWFYWDGRRDSLWAQAVTPLESPGEMDNTRTAIVRHVTMAYPDGFAEVTGIRAIFSDTDRYPTDAGPFGSSAGRSRWAKMSAGDRAAVDRAFAAVGKILAAYVETLNHPSTRFDAFVAALDRDDAGGAQALISDTERRGAHLFLDAGRTHCLRCHNGPSLTNGGFHAIGSQAHFLDLGRQLGLEAARVDPFNCTGQHSDARQGCALTALAGVGAESFAGAFKVPSLRNLAVTAPYFHDGRFATLEEVMSFYLDPPGVEAGNHELPALDLDGDEVEDLIAFLEMLSAEPADYEAMAR